jgi:hypothetical protein
LAPLRLNPDRVGYAIVAIGCVAILVVSRLLSPAAGGQGTHEQLGLPPCTFHLVTGHGCPGCGLTTAFTYMAHGEIASAFGANPLGPLGFAIVALLVPLAAYRAVRPVPVDEVVANPLFYWLLMGLLFAMFVAWGIRLWMGLV